MKKLPSVRVIVMTMIAIILVNIISAFDYNVKRINRVVNSDTKIMASFNTLDSIDYAKEKVTIDSKHLLKTDKSFEVETIDNAVSSVLIEEEIDYSEIYPEIVYEGMTLEQLGDKLDKNLKSTLSGYGYTIASYAIEYDVDPYLAVAIILHETGCNSGSCSGLVKKCNNVGGMKGGPNCGNGSYKKFSSLEKGIESFMKNLSNNYIKKGLKTPEAINKKYAASTTWAGKIKYYMNKIKKN